MFNDVQKNIVNSKQGDLIKLSCFLRSLQKDDFKGGGLASTQFQVREIESTN